MAFISKSTINEVTSRLDAVGIVGDYVRLEKKSGRWWGRCPFHAGGQEKTPSFKVDPDLKMYHCFGCGSGGSVIGFIMEMEKISYPEAIKTLARKMSIEIIYEESAENESKDSSFKEELYELYRRVTLTFQHFLNEKHEGRSSLKYLEDRGVSKEMIKHFRLGYSPSERSFLFKFLKQKGYSDDFLGKSGLFSHHYKEISLFSNRIIFPISDRQGRIVAFGGRTIPLIEQNGEKNSPKYINSPETEIFKKGQTLYAIEQSKNQMRQSKTVIIAEGYMDVIAFHQAGISNAVAPLGTSFTDEQAIWLRRWVDKTVLIFDNDEAGKKAAYKAILTCRKNNLYCNLINLSDFVKKETNCEGYPELKDPADILRVFNPNVLKKLINYTTNDFDYLVFTAAKIMEAEGGKNRAVEFFFPYLEALDSEVERFDCIAKIADAFRIERHAVQKDFYNRNRESYLSGTLTKAKKNDIYTNETVKRNAELVLLTVVAVNMELYKEFRTFLEIREIDDKSAKELFIAMEECFQHDEYGIDLLLARIKDEPLKNFIAKYGDSNEFKNPSPRRLMEDGINKIRKKKLRKRVIEINGEIHNMERITDESINIDELLAEKKAIDLQMREFEGR
jgi:DNA primase